MKKTLEQFQNISDWSDLIRFQTQLQKNITSSLTLQEQLLISKRLAQCLNPQLPAGVHSKTIETYGHIFEVMGSSIDLSIWCIGLFVFVQYASVQVRKSVIDLFRAYIVNVVDQHSCFGVLVALCPCLEEEGEQFDHVIELFDVLKAQVDNFDDCMRRVAVYVPHCRLAVCNYWTLERLPDGDYSFVSELLADSNVLVQRHGMDILLAKCKVQSSVYLMESALCVVLRKEVSLSRRLFQWIKDDCEDFEQLSLPYIVQALSRLVEGRGGTDEDYSRPYKVLTSLLDRPDIGQPVVCRMLPVVLDNLSYHSRGLESANLFLNQIEKKLLFEIVSGLNFRLIDVFVGIHIDNFDYYHMLFQLLLEQQHYDVARKILGIMDERYFELNEERFVDDCVNILFQTDLEDCYDIVLALLMKLKAGSRFLLENEDSVWCWQLTKCLDGGLQQALNLVLCALELQTVNSEVLEQYIIKKQELLFKQLWNLLQSAKLANQHFAVLSLWRLDSLIHLDTLISAHLQVSHEYQSFTVFWMLSPRQNIAEQVPRSIFVMLELLRSGNPHQRVVGELFVKNGLKSVINALDPLLICILTPGVLSSGSSCENGVTVKVSQPQQEQDIEPVYYAFDLVQLILQYGHRNLVQKLASKTINSQTVINLASLALVGYDQKGCSYLNLIMMCIQTYVAHTNYLHIQFKALEIMEFLVEHANGNIGQARASVLQAMCLEKLQQSVDQHQLEVQVKLISLYRNTLPLVVKEQMTISVKKESRKMYSSDSLIRSEPVSPTAPLNESMLSKFPAGNQLLNILVQVISSEANRAVLPYYLDFITASLQYLKVSFMHILAPVLQCIIEQLNSLYSLWYQQGILLEAEIIQLAGTLSKIIVYSHNEVQLHIEANQNQPEGGVLKGLTDMVSGVFQQDLSAEESGNRVKRTILGHKVQLALPVLLQLSLLNDHDVSSKAIQTMDALNKLYPLSILQSLCRSYRQGSLPLHFVVSLSSQQFVSFKQSSALIGLLELVKQTIELQSAKSSSQISLNEDELDSSTATDFLRFANFTVQKFIDAHTLMLQWPSLVQFIKDLHSMGTSAKSLYLELTRFQVQLFNQLPVDFKNDKKHKKEIQELLQKSLDFLILIAGKSFDGWIFRRRDTSQSETASQLASFSIGDSEIQSPRVSKVDLENDSLVESILLWLIEIVPSFPKLFDDGDRLQSLISNMSYYLFTPNLKSQSPQYKSIIQLFSVVVRLPNMHKSWRKDMWELLETDYLPIKHQLDTWKIVVKSAYNEEPGKLLDLLSKLSLSQSGIFASKHQEAVNRAYQLRKLAFVVYCSDYDHFVGQLPAVQEKLADMMRSTFNIVHVDVYLCLQMLYLKYSMNQMSGFWPVVAVDISQYFRSIQIPLENEDLKKLLSVCKFLDVFLLLDFDLYHTYDWIFIQEQVGLCKQVAHKIQDQSQDEVYLDMFFKKRTLLLPASLTTKSVNDAKQLLPFLSTVDRVRIQEVYQLATKIYRAFTAQAIGVAPSDDNKSINLDSRTVDVDKIVQSLEMNFI